MKQFEADLDAALRHAPEVQVPRNFRQRLMTRVPDVPAVERPRTWPLPVLGALAGLVFGVLMLTALQLGLAGWLARPGTLFVILGIETAGALVWLWRTVFSR